MCFVGEEHQQRLKGFTDLSVIQVRKFVGEEHQQRQGRQRTMGGFNPS